MIVGGVFYDFWLVLIGFFVYLGASAEEQAAERERPGSARARPPTPHAPSTGVITMSQPILTSRGRRPICEARRMTFGPVVCGAPGSSS